jgi:hypothetical protein
VWDQEIGKMSAEFFSRFFSQRRQETDDEFLSYISEAVITGVKETDSVNRFIERLRSLK